MKRVCVRVCACSHTFVRQRNKKWLANGTRNDAGNTEKVLWYTTLSWRTWECVNTENNSVKKMVLQWWYSQYFDANEIWNDAGNTGKIRQWRIWEYVNTENNSVTKMLLLYDTLKISPMRHDIKNTITLFISRLVSEENYDGRLFPYSHKFRANNTRNTNFFIFFISCLDGEESYDIALFLFIYAITIFLVWYDTSPTTHCIFCIIGKEITRDVQKSKDEDTISRDGTNCRGILWHYTIPIYIWYHNIPLMIWHESHYPPHFLCRWPGNHTWCAKVQDDATISRDCTSCRGILWHYIIPIYLWYHTICLMT